jgi:FkbH-like protein
LIGVVGEDGIDGIQLSLQSPGNSFLAFQQAILDHYNRGIILAINSRNNPEDAWNVIRNHPNQILKEHHFAASRINWNDKATNIRELAIELNIGLDSMVFLDDDETNREMVKALIPEVTVPDLPKEPKEYTRFLHGLPYFVTETITDEDKMRGNLYVTERLRKEEEKSHATKESFLSGLGLELALYKNDLSCLPRLAQLTEKTNQFNVAKHPYTEEDLVHILSSGNYDSYYGKLTDVFGDYGVILFALIKKEEKKWHIETLLMSCRVFGRGVEDAFFAFINSEAYAQNVEEIGIAYKESEKNIPAKEFIDRYFTNLAFTPSKDISSGPHWIKVQNI